MQKMISASPIVTQQEIERNLGATKLRFQISKQPVEARLALLQKSFKRQDILNSSLAVKNTLSLLSALECDIQTKLSKIFNRSINMPLHDGEADVLNQRIADLLLSLVKKVLETNLRLNSALNDLGVGTTVQPETCTLLPAWLKSGPALSTEAAEVVPVTTTLSRSKCNSLTAKSAIAPSED
jgi:hypothetical protein